MSHKEFIEFLHARFSRYGDGHGIEKKGIALHFANGLVSGTNRSYIARQGTVTAILPIVGSVHWPEFSPRSVRHTICQQTLVHPDYDARMITSPLHVSDCHVSVLMIPEEYAGTDFGCREPLGEIWLHLVT